MYKESHLNFPGDKIHEMITNVFDALSFNVNQIEFISKTAKEKLSAALIIRKKLLLGKEKDLNDILSKIERLETRLINEEIEAVTYKKWYRKLNSDKSSPEENIIELKSNISDKWERLEKLLELLTDLKTFLSEL